MSRSHLLRAIARLEPRLVDSTLWVFCASVLYGLHVGTLSLPTISLHLWFLGFFVFHTKILTMGLGAAEKTPFLLSPLHRERWVPINCASSLLPTLKIIYLHKEDGNKKALRSLHSLSLASVKQAADLFLLVLIWSRTEKAIVILCHFSSLGYSGPCFADALPVHATLLSGPFEQIIGLH